MRIIIVGHINSEVSLATQIASKNGARVVHAPSTVEALNLLLSGKGADILFVDANDNIRQLCADLKREHINITVVAYGINCDSKKAAEAIKAGAEEYIPFPPQEDLIAAVLESISNDKISVISESENIKQVFSLADRIAPSDANVLITGESGTGKEVLAKYIHRKSARKNENFISINCAAIPENLLESELFGHEKGAFTGAQNRRIGKFEESNNGTLLLDEISEMDLRLQAKLLRAIQEKEIDRVGGSQPVKVNLRVLATSNRDLRKEVAEGRFREDLYFRLNVINLQIPPLRERKEDIMKLAEYFAKKYAESNGMELPTISKGAEQALLNYEWKGNVRELENTMHRAVLLNKDNIIDETALLLNNYGQKKMEATSGAAVAESDSSAQNFVGRSVADVEKELILNTLSHYSNNRTHAANILGISIRTLRNKLKEYNLDDGGE
jgi:DNA-binding NtrC family response regulator